MSARHNLGGVSDEPPLKNDIVTMTRIPLCCGAPLFDFRCAIRQIIKSSQDFFAGSVVDKRRE